MGNEGTRTWIADLGNGRYRNPILYTDYSDPDVIRVGEDYYMVASSFCNAPSVPLLHSKDLVNWKVINYCVDQVPGDRYRTPQHGCGAWAPAIRFHEGVYYVFIPMPDEGIFEVHTTDPYGEWSAPHFLYEGKGWIDPCPFWDEDGKAYMVNAFAKSRIGFKSILQIVEMTPDCQSLIGEGKYVFDGNVNDQETIEGPKLYKRNGYYYIMAPAGGVKTGWQTVLRSKNIWGPYEAKNVLYQGDTPVNGPHQGGWIDTPYGEDWFIHFQDVYAAGRIIHLQPMRWVNDWPIIGEYVEGRDYGTPVLEYDKPKVSKEDRFYPIEAPDASDEFDGVTLGLQWQWNANDCKEWYTMDPEGSSVILHCVPAKPEESISDAPNLLLQKWVLPEFTAETKMTLDQLQPNDFVGMVSMGMTYGAVGVRKSAKGLELVKVLGSQHFSNEKSHPEDTDEVVATLPNLSEIYFRNTVKSLEPKEEFVPREEISFSVSTDGEHYTDLLSFESQAGRWVGVKNGVFAIHEQGDTQDPAGNTAVDYFRIF
ncbi:MAG: glycoside hydrolase 43 family protein [Lachnospiraceae bacterium]|nr:glycoside hydrolase 43 family protein [Lachnospiraceae bacterium]